MNIKPSYRWEKGKITDVTTARLTGLHGASILIDGKTYGVSGFIFPQHLQIGDELECFIEFDKRITEIREV